MKQGHRKRKRFKRRQLHVRRGVFGSEEKPRMAVNRSLKHICCQLIDDENGVTLVACSSLDKELRQEMPGSGGNVACAAKVGEEIAKKAAEKNIKKVIFDRRGYKYHGRVKALADAARKKGLIF